MQLVNPFQVLMEKLNHIEETLQELKLQRLAPQETPESDLLSIVQASALLGMVKNTIYGLTSQSKIPVIKKGKRLYFSKQELLKWIRSGRRATLDDCVHSTFNHRLAKGRRSGIDHQGT
jgi:excisionase family DNA binding protein